MNVVLLALLLLTACAEREPQMATSRDVTRSTPTAERLSTIGIAQALMHETDVLEGMGDRAAAIERAERVLSLELSEDDPLREPLRLDAYGRLAELQLAQGSIEDAEATVDRGLGSVSTHSYFEARLHLVRGRVLEARAASLREAGDRSRAEEMLRAALAEHERSIEINEALLAQNIHVMHQVGRIRLAVHGYNTAQDIDAVLATLREITPSSS
jgi:tetratricopeptide (TPR) repeat protein